MTLKMVLCHGVVCISPGLYLFVLDPTNATEGGLKEAVAETWARP
jgi:hypothetical protein